MKKHNAVVLFILLCAGALNGMESEQGRFKGLGGLPPEVQVMIIQTLHNTYDDNLNAEENLKNIIKDIKATSLVDKELHKIINDMYGNQPGFTALAHMLAKKLNISTFRVAQAFNTDASQEYLALGTALANAIRENNSAQVAELISQGADVNFMEKPANLSFLSLKYRGNTLLITAILYKNSADMIKLLLDAGANPNLEGHLFEALFNKFKKTKYSEEVAKIRILLDDARRKQ